MEKKMYWLWLTLIKGLSPANLCELVRMYGSPEAIYREQSFDNLGFIGKTAKKGLLDKSMRNAEKVLLRMKELGGYILTIDDEEYPKLLRNIYAPPCVLYAVGQHMDWDSLLTISIVGTRKYTSYGRRCAKTIAHDLAEDGATVVSGMARGIDSISNEAALNGGGMTVAVLGSGVDVIYPAELRELYERIKENGVVISEFPPGSKPDGFHFPQRNRVIAGLSYGTLVVEAPERSGSLITSARAMESGRDVFAVPGDIFDFNYAGTNGLLKAGAKAVTCANDILEEYQHLNLGMPADKVQKKSGTEHIDISSLSDNEAKIIKLLSNQVMHADELARELGISGAEIGSILIMLEISGYISKNKDSKYELV